MCFDLQLEHVVVAALVAEVVECAEHEVEEVDREEEADVKQCMAVFIDWELPVLLIFLCRTALLVHIYGRWTKYWELEHYELTASSCVYHFVFVE